MDDEPDLGLEDVFTKAPSPPPPASTFAQYDMKYGEKLSIKLVGSHPLWGHYLWNAARSFASHLERNADELCRGKTVLELGAGGGLPGIIAVRCGARKVLLTDYPDAPLIENLKLNVENNIPPEIRDVAVVEGYVWGRSVSELLSNVGITRGGFDLILMSDLIFNHSQHDALLDTAESCLMETPQSQSDPSKSLTPCVLVFYTHHRPDLSKRDLEFFVKAKARGWSCEEILTEKFKPMFPEDPGDEAVRSMVHGWQMKRFMENAGLLRTSLDAVLMSPSIPAVDRRLHDSAIIVGRRLSPGHQFIFLSDNFGPASYARVLVLGVRTC